MDNTSEKTYNEQKKNLLLHFLKKEILMEKNVFDSLLISCKKKTSICIKKFFEELKRFIQVEFILF